MYCLQLGVSINQLDRDWARGGSELMFGYGEAYGALVKVCECPLSPFLLC